jgi:hypothetical protein
MNSHQETQGGMRYRHRPHNAAGHARHRADRSTLGLYACSRSAQRHPAAIGGAVMVQTPRAQAAIPKGAVQALSHLRQKLGKVRIFKEEIMQYDSELSENTTREGTKHNKIQIQVVN